MSRRGMRWFKLDADIFDDPKVQDLVERHGAEGAGVWLAVMVEMHLSISEGAPFVPSDRLVKRVAFDLQISRRKARNIIGSLVDVSLLNREFWEEGKAANERVAESCEAYARRCEALERARSERWAKPAETPGDGVGDG